MALYRIDTTQLCIIRFEEKYLKCTENCTTIAKNTKNKCCTCKIFIYFFFCNSKDVEKTSCALNYLQLLEKRIYTTHVQKVCIIATFYKYSNL